MIKFEARKYVPVPLGEVEMDWWVLDYGRKEKAQKRPEAQKKTNIPMAEVLLIAIHKEIVQRYQEIFKKAGLKTKFFEIELFGAWRSSIFRPTTPVMMMDLGALSTKVSVIDRGMLRASHTIDRGAQAITDGISKSLGIGFARAEEMKREIGLSPKPEHKELVNVMEATLNFIFSEAKQFMISYRKKYDDSVGQVVLTGGGALLEGILDLAVKSLGIEIALADPFAKTKYPPFLQETVRQIGPSFSTAVGLALRGL
jgi:type IV pilus assembly protein PilM